MKRFVLLLIATFYTGWAFAEVEVRLTVSLERFDAPTFHYPHYDEMNGQSGQVKILFETDEQGYVDSYLPNEVIEEDLKQVIETYLFSEDTQFDNKINSYGFLEVKYHASESEHYRSLIGQFHALYDNNEYEKAHKIIHQAYQMEPENPASNYLMGNVLYKLSKPNWEQYYKKAISLSPDNPLPYYSLAYRFYITGDISQAQQYLDDAEKLSAETWEIQWLKSAIAKSKGEFNKAAQYLAYAIELNPDNDYLHAEQGWLFLDEEAFLLAEGSFKKALELDPNDGYSISGLARALYDQERYSEAKKYILKNLERDATDKYDLYLAGLIFDELGEYPIAESYLLSLVEIDEQYESVLNNLGYLYTKMERYESAEEYFRRAQELFPGNKRILNNFGVVKFLQNNCQAAMSLFEQARSITDDGDDHFAQVYIARCHIKSGNLDEAYRLLNTALEENPDYYDGLYEDLHGEGNHLPVAIQEYLAVSQKDDRRAKTLLDKLEAYKNE